MLSVFDGMSNLEISKIVANCAKFDKKSDCANCTLRNYTNCTDLLLIEMATRIVPIEDDGK